MIENNPVFNVLLITGGSNRPLLRDRQIGFNPGIVGLRRLEGKFFNCRNIHITVRLILADLAMCNGFHRQLFVTGIGLVAIPITIFQTHGFDQGFFTVI